jgi:RNA polymerase sigma-70 factor (ECF subfamily)
MAATAMASGPAAGASALAWWRVLEPTKSLPVAAESDADLAAEPGLAGLVQAAMAGSEDAFHGLYRRFAPVVHGIVLSRVGRHDADDTTQEVFLGVHRRLGSLRDAAAFPAWICTLARNAATDCLRRRARRPRPEPLPDEPAAPCPVDDGELRERLLALIHGLPEAYGETLVLRLVEGLSGPEIAARTGLTPGSVRVNLCRGMALLRPLLAQEGWS